MTQTLNSAAKESQYVSPMDLTRNTSSALSKLVKLKLENMSIQHINFIPLTVSEKIATKILLKSFLLNAIRRK